MDLFLEILGVAYLASFVWFWILCRVAVRRDHSASPASAERSNLIPFERGIQVQLQRARAM